MKRYGSVIKIKLDKLEEYKKLHANIWPGVKKTVSEGNIRHGTIFYKDGFLFRYFEYVGNDFETDMKKMEDNSITQKWCDICVPMQEPLETRKEGEWWAYMEEISHVD